MSCQNLHNEKSKMLWFLSLKSQFKGETGFKIHFKIKTDVCYRIINVNKKNEQILVSYLWSFGISMVKSPLGFYSFSLKCNFFRFEIVLLNKWRQKAFQAGLFTQNKKTKDTRFSWRWSSIIIHEKNAILEKFWPQLCSLQHQWCFEHGVLLW